MNSIIAKHYPVFQMYQELRSHLMGVLTDEDLTFRMPSNPPLGDLCREIGEVEQSYMEALDRLRRFWPEVMLQVCGDYLKTKMLCGCPNAFI